MTTVSDILNQLTPNMTVDQIRAKVNTWDMNVGSGTLLLYSGGVGDVVGTDPVTGAPQREFKAQHIAEKLANGTTVVTIKDTGIESLFDNLVFQVALQNAIDNDPLYTGRTYEEVLFGRDSSGRIGDGFWDDVSRNLVNQHDGDFQLIMPDAPNNGIGIQTEVTALLEKSFLSGQQVNGINLQDWQANYDFNKALAISGGMTSAEAESFVRGEINDLIRQTSGANLADIVIGQDANGLHVKVAGTYFGEVLGVSGDLPVGVQGVRISSLDGIETNLAVFAKYGDFLKTAGIVGEVLGAAIVVAQVTEAHNAGDDQKAGRLLAEYAGSLAGGVAGGTVLAGAAAGLVAFFGAPVAAGIVIVGAAGLAGSYLGGSQGEEWFGKLYDDISSLGLIPYIESLKDNVSWAVNNSEAVLEDFLAGFKTAGQLASEFNVPNVDALLNQAGNEWLEDRRISLPNGTQVFNLKSGDEIFLPPDANQQVTLRVGISIDGGSPSYGFWDNVTGSYVGPAWINNDKIYALNNDDVEWYRNADGTYTQYTPALIAGSREAAASRYGDAKNNGQVTSTNTSTVQNGDGTYSKVTNTSITSNGHFFSVKEARESNSSGVPITGGKITTFVREYDTDGTTLISNIRTSNFTDDLGYKHTVIESQDGVDGNWRVQEFLYDAAGKSHAGAIYVVPNSDLLDSLQYIGGTAGSLLGGYLADENAYKDIVYSAFLGAVLKHFGTFTAYLATEGNGLEQALKVAMGETVQGSTVMDNPAFSETFYSILSSKISSALANVLIDEVGDALNLDGVVGEVFDVVGGAVTTGIINETFGVLFNNLNVSPGAYSALLNSGFNFDTSIMVNGQSMSVGDYIQSQVTQALASYVGARLAGELIEPESEMAAMLGSLGAAISTAIVGGQILSNATALSNLLSLGAGGGPVGIAIAAFIGTVAGTSLGNIFGGGEMNPASWADIKFNYQTGEYYIANNWGHDGGSAALSAQMANAVIGGINEILGLTQGALRSGAKAPELTIGWKEGDFIVHIDGQEIGSFDSTGGAIGTAAFHLAKNFDLVGGHAVLMRAWHNTDADNIYEFKEDIMVAEAFQTYLLNPAGILAMMMDQPDSKTAQTWASILDRAAALELHLPHEKDLDGGWGELLLARGDINPELIPNIREDSLVLTDPVTGQEIVLKHVFGPGYEIVRIEGTNGNDVIQVIVDGPSISYVDAGAGDDLIEGSEQNDILIGGPGDDTINGNGGDDWINGGPGNDDLNGNGGYDLIAGGDDDDFIEGGSSDDRIHGGAGNDIIYGRGGQDKLYGGAGNDTLYSETDVLGDELYGEDGNDTLHVDTRYGIVNGGKGNDLILLNDHSNVIQISRGDGHDEIQLVQKTSPNILRFDATISANELWFSKSGNDMIISVLGSDQKVTLKNLHTYTNLANVIRIESLDGYLVLNNPLTTYQHYQAFSQAPTGTLNEISDTVIKERTSINLWSFNTNLPPSDYSTLTQPDIDTNQTFQTAVDGTGAIIIGGNGNDSILGQTDYTYAMGGAGNDTFQANQNVSGLEVVYFGDTGNDTITGGKAADILYGGAGDDIIDGKKHNDKIFGGLGNDTLYGDHDFDYLDGGEGTDYLNGGLHEDELHGGNGNDTLYDVDGSNLLFGDGGNDALTTGSGNDVLEGGAGNDTLVAGAGTDRLIGGDGDDILSGNDGDDTLEGGSGVDTLDGNAGNDRVYGGLGNDILKFTLSENLASSNIYSGGVGMDTLTISLTSAQIADIDLQHELLVYHQLISKYQQEPVNTNNDYRFKHFDLRAQSIETLDVKVNGSTYNIQQNFVAGAWKDSASLKENSSIILDLLANDLVASGTTLSVDAVGAAANGIVTLRPDNKVVYAPNSGYSGNDSFTYTVDDGNGHFTTATVYITVEPLNKAPTANTDNATTAETTATSINVLANDSDVEGNAFSILRASKALHGTASLNSNGTIAYTPESGFVGTDEVYYLIKDVMGGYTTGKAIVNVTASTVRTVYNGTSGNDTINTGNDNGWDIVYDLGGNDRIDIWMGNDIYYYTSGRDEVFSKGSTSYDVLYMNNTTIDSATLAASDRLNDGYFDHLKVTLSAGVNELLIIGGIRTDNTEYRWEKLNFGDGFSLTINNFQQWITGADGNSSNNTIFGTSGVNTLHGNGGHDEIVGYAGDDVLYGDAGDDQIHGGNGNDVLYGGQGSDKLWGASGNDTLDFIVAEGSGASDIYIGGAGIDTLRINMTTQEATNIPFIHELRRFHNFIGSFAGNDNAVNNNFLFENIGLLAKSIENLDVYVNGVAYDVFQNFAPVAQNESTHTILNTSRSINVLSNDTDNDYHKLSVDQVTTPSNGTVTINIDNSVTYTPNVGFTGTDTFDYTVIDSRGGSDTGSVTVTVLAQNLSPTLVNDSYTLLEDTQSIFSVLSNDTDPESDALDVIATSLAMYGSVTLNTNDTVTYMPSLNYTGTDKFYYAVRDFFGAVSVARSSLTISLNSAHSIYQGTAGNDTFDTNSVNTNDVFHLGLGNDYAKGGGGDDIAYYTGGLDTVFTKGVGAYDVIHIGASYSLDSAVFAASDYTYATSTSGGGYFDHIMITFDANNKLLMQSSARTDNTEYRWDKMYFADGFALTVNNFQAWISNADGNSSDNTIFGNASSNTIHGNNGHDEIIGYAGNDVLYGDGGNDYLYGGDGNDSLIGGTGNDKLWGKAGADTLNGGAGNDILAGGAGSDTFILNLESSSFDVIQDFSLAENDTLDISDILSGFDPLHDAIADFVQVTEYAGYSTVSIDTNGGGDNFQLAAVLEGVSDMDDLNALLQSGRIVT